MKKIWFQQKGKIIDLRLDERAGEQDKKVSGQKTVKIKEEIGVITRNCFDTTQVIKQCLMF